MSSIVSASLLIFVGSTKVECKLHLSESMEKNRNSLNNRFRKGELLCLNVAKYPCGLEDQLQDFERTMFSKKNILTNSGITSSSNFKLSNTSKSSKLVMTHSTASGGYGHKNMRSMKVYSFVGVSKSAITTNLM